MHETHGKFLEDYHPPSNRQHLSYDDCLKDKRENYQNCYLLCCVQQLCTVICTHTCEWTVFKAECWFRFSFCVFVWF